MKYIIIATMMLFATNAYAGQYSLRCEVVKGFNPELRRCENGEVVCYVVSGSGRALNCKFK
jgi:hypothetical protein